MRRARGIHRGNSHRGHKRVGHEPAVEGVPGGIDLRLARRPARAREPLIGGSQQRIPQPRPDRGHGPQTDKDDDQDGSIAAIARTIPGVAGKPERA